MAGTGTKSPRTNTCIWILCMFLVLKFGPWFLTRFVLQSVGPQPLQDTASKALAKEMVPAFQPLCPAGLLHPTGLMMEHEMGTWLSPGSQSSACTVVLCPSELPWGNLTVLITLQDREQQAPFGEGACESRVEARAGTPWRTPLNTLPNRNPGRQQVSPTHCCQRAVPCPCGTSQTQGRSCSGWRHVPIREPGIQGMVVL